MKITSSGFENNTTLPSKYTCDGEGVNPPLCFSDIPEFTESLVLIVDDPDAPIQTFVHWVLYNMDPKTREIKENSIPQSALRGKTSIDGNNYFAPCPPSGTHRYFFKLYALDIRLNLENPSASEIEEAMQDHILDTAELIGLYNKK